MRASVSWILMTVAVCACGCTSSRWAMDDPEYAEKYSRPYEEGEKIPRMAKQMIDARHLSGATGCYLGAMGAGTPASAAGEIGVFIIPPFETPWLETPWLETRGALAGVVSEDHTGAAGIDLGARVQAPSRLAPFAGVGILLAVADEDLWYIAEEDEMLLGAVYPELGLHFWLTSRTRLSTFGRYYVSGNTSHSGVTDYWATGLSLSFVTN